jgi:hypothetical protein
LRDARVAVAICTLFRESDNADEVRLLEEVRDDLASDPKLSQVAADAFDTAMCPPHDGLPIPPEQIFKWRSLVADAGDSDQEGPQ